MFSYRNTTVYILVLLCSLTACLSNYGDGKPVTRISAFPRVMEKARQDKRYFIMHSGIDTFAITSLLVEKGKNEFTVHLNKLDSLHRLHNAASSTEKQAKLFMRDSVSYTLDEPHTIPFNRVARIELVN